MTKPVFVTGAGGFVGGALVRALLERGVPVHALVRTRAPALERQERVRVFIGDLGDRAAVLRASENCEGAFHVAAKAGVWGEYDAYYRCNVEGTENVLAAAKANGLRKLVYTSTPSVVHAGGDVSGLDERAPYAARFETAYPRTKALAERQVLATDGPTMATVALRPHLVWGPGDRHLVPRILDRARRGRLALVGDGSNRIDATFIDSAVHAHLCAWDRLEPGAACAGKAYFIAQGEPMPLRELIDGILHAADLPPVHRSIDPRIAWLAGAAFEGAYRALRIDREPPMTRFVARQLSTAHWFDLGAAERDLGYRAPITTREGLARLRASIAAERRKPSAPIAAG